MKRFLFLLAASLFLQSSAHGYSEGEWLKRLRSFTILSDFASGEAEAKEALKAFPDSPSIQEESIRLFAKSGDIDEAIKLFRNYQQKDYFIEWPRDLIEDISWAVIEQSSRSSSLPTKAISLIAAAIGNDARGVNILARNMTDTNRVIRLLSVDFASHFRDQKLKDAVESRLNKEPDFTVRLELIRAAGKMKIEEAEEELLAILSRTDAGAEERLAAIESIVALKEKVDRTEIEKLSKSPRGALRALAAKLIQFNDNVEDADLLIPLLKDPMPEVRLMAVFALASLRVPEVNGTPLSDILLSLDSDPRYEVALGAALALTLHSPSKGHPKFLKSFRSDDEEERLFATAALMAAGKYGFPLTLQMFKETNDPFVKLNLARVMIQERVRSDLAAESLFKAVTDFNTRWMSKKIGPSELILKSEGMHRADIPNYAEAMNQMSRLEILNQLAMLSYPEALVAVRKYLTESCFGISGAASALLLTEGEEEMLELVKQLLNDPSDNLRLQAALVLASLGGDPAALQTLVALYPKVPRNQKEQIIEAVGHVGDLNAMPFLLDRLAEPHQKERMIAAASLLLLLYH